MQPGPDGLNYLVGGPQTILGISGVRALPVFDGRVVEFLGALSRHLLADPRARAYGDLASYAFWIRPASLEKARGGYPDAGERIGRGVSFHIAPSNVPVAFAVSLTYALLAGNACLVRVSSRPFEQTSLVCEAMGGLLSSDFADLAPYLGIVRYAHDRELTARLSSVSDVRLVWGGNRTIQEIRAAGLPPRAIELAFADRHSLAILDADEYLKADAARVARDFYTDTFFNDQNACSSPRLVVWMGRETDRARWKFWEELEKLARVEYDLTPIQAVDKLDALCRLAAGHPGVRRLGESNHVVRVELDRLSADLMDFKEGGGFFFEYLAGSLDELVPVLGKSCQTVACLGIPLQAVRDLVLRTGVRGVDRVVPLGQTNGLSFVWDGYDLIRTMSRIVCCEE